MAAQRIGDLSRGCPGHPIENLGDSVGKVHDVADDVLSQDCP
jgi:hypothetical protein